jgi:hypothetical protein
LDRQSASENVTECRDRRDRVECSPLLNPSKPLCKGTRYWGNSWAAVPFARPVLVHRPVPHRRRAAQAHRASQRAIAKVEVGELRLRVAHSLSRSARQGSEVVWKMSIAGRGGHRRAQAAPIDRAPRSHARLPFRRRRARRSRPDRAVHDQAPPSSPWQKRRASAAATSGFATTLCLRLGGRRREGIVGSRSTQGATEGLTLLADRLPPNSCRDGSPQPRGAGGISSSRLRPLSAS